jgi:D-lactate dehydrogenase
MPEYSPNAITQHAVSLLLAVNSKLIESNRRVKHFNFNLTDLVGFDLNNKIVGIIGTVKNGYCNDKDIAWLWLSYFGL